MRDSHNELSWQILGGVVEGGSKLPRVVDVQAESGSQLPHSKWRSV